MVLEYNQSIDSRPKEARHIKEKEVGFHLSADDSEDPTAM
jgi:hypothetical protein